MKLSKPLAVFDLETTGAWVDKDKIIEIAIIKCLPDGNRETYHKRVNPGMPIPDVVAELTGINNEMVKEAPAFKDIAQEVLSFIEGCDFGGFNVERFDLPILQRELQQAGQTFVWDKAQIFDAQKVFHINEKRDLTAAYKFYCQKELGEDAHSALADTQATLDILEAQVEQYGKGDENIEVLKQFNYRQSSEFYDEDRRFRWWNGKLYMMFGKYARKHSLQDVVKQDKGYLKWILSADFSQEIKDLITKALDGEFPTYTPPQAPDSDEDSDDEDSANESSDSPQLKLF